MIRRAVRLLAVAAGAGLLVWIAPHRNPWEMSHSVAVGLPPWTFGVLAAAGLALGALVVLPWRRLGPPRIAVLVAAAACLAFSLWPASPRGRGVVTWLCLATVGTLLVAAGLAERRLVARVEALARGAAAFLGGLPLPAYLGALFSFVFVVANLGSYGLLGHVPHVVDEAAQLFHARIFLGGRLTAATPPAPEFFVFTHVISNGGGRWYSQYPPGHTLLLALGLAARAPWIVGPLFGALSVVLLYFIGKEAYDEPTGRLAALAGALSPFVWIMASSFMNHTTTLFFLGLFLLGFVRVIGRGGLGDAALSGFALGAALAIRPLTAAAFGAPCALYGAIHLVRLRFWGRCLAALAAFAVPFGGLLTFNALTNGHPLLFGYEVLHGEQALPGFGSAGGLRATLNNLNALNQYLYGLPLPSLLLPLTGLAWLKPRRWDGLWLAVVASLASAYFFYGYQDWAFGPRFLYCAVGPLALLTARSLLALEAGRPLLLVLAVALGYGWTVDAPLLARFYGRNYADGNAPAARACEQVPLRGALVLVPGLYYPSVFAQNEPSLDGPVVYARDLGEPKNSEVVRAFPDRRPYKLRSLAEYAVVPYDPAAAGLDVTYRLAPEAPLTVEALTFQLSHLANGSATNRRTGELGGDWRNHDQLWIGANAPGAEVGFVLDAAEPAERSLLVVLTRSPESGIVELRLNGELLRPALDLYSAEPGVERVAIDRVGLHAGENGLLFRVVGRSAGARSAGLGLDYFTLDRAVAGSGRR